MKVINSTPKKDGFRMPAEFEPQERVWMIWPERTDNWRDGAKPAQKTYRDIAVAISEFTPVTMCVSNKQFANCRSVLPDNIRVVEMSSNDSWIRDCGPIFVKNDKTERVYKVPGGEGFIKLFAIVPFVLLILGVIFTLFGDFSMEYINENLPLIVGVAVSFIVQEILVARVKETKKK